jgi:hypothetical protein
MKFSLYIDKKFTYDGIRVFVGFYCSAYSYSNIFRCRVEKVLAPTKESTVPVYLFGHKTSFKGVSQVYFVQGRETFEAVTTPNVAIGAGSPYQHSNSDTLVFTSGGVNQDMVGASVSFDNINTNEPLLADLSVPASYSNNVPYKALFINQDIKITEVLDTNKCKINIPFPCNVSTPLNCTINTGTETISGKCLVQSTTIGSKVVFTPNPYTLVLKDRFIEQFNEVTSALAFIASIKADVQRYIDQLKSIGTIDGVEVKYYET